MSFLINLHRFVFNKNANVLLFLIVLLVLSIFQDLLWLIVFTSVLINYSILNKNFEKFFFKNYLFRYEISVYFEINQISENTKIVYLNINFSPTSCKS